MLLYKFKHNLTNSLPIIHVNTKSVTVLDSSGDRIGSLVAHVCLYSQYPVRSQMLLVFSVRVYGVVLLMRHRSILRSDAFPATTNDPDGNRTQELLFTRPRLLPIGSLVAFIIKIHSCATVMFSLLCIT